jgi:hypothetical protein
MSEFFKPVGPTLSEMQATNDAANAAMTEDEDSQDATDEERSTPDEGQN